MASAHADSGRLEAIERDAWSDCCAAAPADVAARLGLRLARIDAAAVAVMTALDHGQFNRTIGLGIDEPASEQGVDAILASYEQAARRNFLIHLAPGAQPAVLPLWLEARGLRPHPRRTGKFRHAATAPPADSGGLDIRVVEQDRGADFAAVVCAGFGMPVALAPWLAALAGRDDWRVYVGCDRGTPIAAGALFVAGRAAWLGIGTTLPGHRRRGAHRALMQRRVHDALALGCTDIVSETGEAVPGERNSSWNNMRRAGFELAYSRLNYGRF